MTPNFLDRIKDGLVSQHRNLLDWIHGASPAELENRLGPCSKAELDNHVKTLETAIRKTEDHTLGLCTECHDYIEPSRLEVDYTASVCLEHLSQIERSRLEAELELSAKVQKALLPDKVPDVEGIDLAAFTQPAQIVGGDYFDFFSFQNERFGFTVGDVMGKGISASLLMSNLQASLRILVKDQWEISVILDRLNALFSHNIRLTKFVTLFLARYEPATRTLVYGNAGHNPPLLVKSDGTHQWLKPNGAAIGLIERSDYNCNDIRVDPGDLLVLYTDGVTETHNAANDEFGEEGLTSAVFSAAGKSPQDVIRTIRDRMNAFRGDRQVEDDATLLVGRFK